VCQKRLKFFWSNSCGCIRMPSFHDFNCVTSWFNWFHAHVTTSFGDLNCLASKLYGPVVASFYDFSQGFTSWFYLSCLHFMALTLEHPPNHIHKNLNPSILIPIKLKIHTNWLYRLVVETCPEIQGKGHVLWLYH